MPKIRKTKPVKPIRPAKTYQKISSFLSAGFFFSGMVRLLYELGSWGVSDFDVVLFDRFKEGVDQLWVAGAESGFLITDIKVDGLLDFAIDIWDALAGWDLATSDHHLDELADLIFHILIDRIDFVSGLTDEGDLTNGLFDVFADEGRRSGGSTVLGFFAAGDLIVLKEANQIVDEGRKGDATEETVFCEPDFLDFGDIMLGFLFIGLGGFEVLFAFADAGKDDAVDGFVDWENAFEDLGVLIVIDADAVIGQFENGRFLSEDVFVEIADLLLKLFAVFARLLKDVLQVGVLIDFDDDAALFILVSFWIILITWEGELKHVADDHIVMDQGR
jgi:hypothetical protein